MQLQMIDSAAAKKGGLGVIEECKCVEACFELELDQ